MSAIAEQEAVALLARSARLKLFVVLRRTVDRDRARSAMPDHIRWMIDRERAGVIFMSGPIAPNDGRSGLNGLTLLRSANLDTARAAIAEDPIVRSGAVEVEVCEWSVNEGRLTLEVSLSDSSVVIHADA